MGSTRHPQDIDAYLGRVGEEEWQRLRQQIDLASGFWLAFLFTSSPAVARAFRGRFSRLMALRGNTTRILTPQTPEEMRRVVSQLVELAGTGASSVWLESLAVDSLTGQNSAGPWAIAW